jgi:hypothetical protein
MFYPDSDLFNSAANKHQQNGKRKKRRERKSRVNPGAPYKLCEFVRRAHFGVEEVGKELAL